MVKVITYGTYDVMHYGHIRLLERAKALGDYLIVGVTSDDYDKTRGKINNQQTLMERIAAVRATGLADEIIVEEYEGQKIDDIRRLDVDIFTVGSDWEGTFDYLNEYCKVIYLPRTQGISSSEIREKERRLTMGTIGYDRFCSKFVREMDYVNGVQYKECDDSFEGVDAVYIATLPERHYEDIKRALKKKKHVICESPITVSEEKCRELLQLAKEEDVILTDGNKTAYSTAYSRLLVVAKSGRIGDIVSVDAVCTSLAENVWEKGVDLREKTNTICHWGPNALLPVFHLLGTSYKDMKITTHLLDEELNFDGFTKIDFTYPGAVASVKMGRAAKAEGELVITGTKGYIYVPAPWWMTDYFEVRFEDPSQNKRHFYQLDGEGIRYEIVDFVKTISSKKHSHYVDEEISIAMAKVIEKFYNREYTTF